MELQSSAKGGVRAPPRRRGPATAGSKAKGGHGHSSGCSKGKRQSKKTKHTARSTTSPPQWSGSDVDNWLCDLFSRKSLSREDLDNYLLQREVDPILQLNGGQMWNMSLDEFHLYFGQSSQAVFEEFLQLLQRNSKSHFDFVVYFREQLDRQRQQERRVLAQGQDMDAAMLSLTPASPSPDKAWDPSSPLAIAGSNQPSSPNSTLPSLLPAASTTANVCCSCQQVLPLAQVVLVPPLTPILAPFPGSPPIAQPTAFGTGLEKTTVLIPHLPAQAPILNSAPCPPRSQQLGRCPSAQHAHQRQTSTPPPPIPTPPGRQVSSVTTQPVAMGTMKSAYPFNAGSQPASTCGGRFPSTPALPVPTACAAQLALTCTQIPASLSAAGSLQLSPTQDVVSGSPVSSAHSDPPTPAGMPPMFSNYPLDQVSAQSPRSPVHLSTNTGHRCSAQTPSPTSDQLTSSGDEVSTGQYGKFPSSPSSLGQLSDLGMSCGSGGIDEDDLLSICQLATAGNIDDTIIALIESNDCLCPGVASDTGSAQAPACRYPSSPSPVSDSQAAGGFSFPSTVSAGEVSVTVLDAGSSFAGQAALLADSLDQAMSQDSGSCELEAMLAPVPLFQVSAGECSNSAVAQNGAYHNGRTPTSVDYTQAELTSSRVQQEEHVNLCARDIAPSAENSDLAYVRHRKLRPPLPPSLVFPSSAGPVLYEFLLELLHKPDTYTLLIHWVNQSRGLFRLQDTESVAALWGVQRRKLSMNYDKMSRALRYYNNKKANIFVLEKVKSVRRTYRFLAGSNWQQYQPRATGFNFTFAGNTTLSKNGRVSRRK